MERLDPRHQTNGICVKRRSYCFEKCFFMLKISIQYSFRCQYIIHDFLTRHHFNLPFYIGIIGDTYLTYEIHKMIDDLNIEVDFDRVGFIQG